MAAQSVEVLLIGNASSLKAAFAESAGVADTTSTSMSEKMAGIGKIATVAFAGAAVAVGAFAMKMADEFESAHARLTTSIKNAGDSWKTEETAVSNVDSKMEKLGFTNAQTESSLSGLVNATHDTGKAIDLMGLAADIARGRHVDLATAVGILTKVETGHVALLGRLGINTKDVTGATITQEEAIKRLTAMYGGQASAYTATFSGKVEVLKATMTDLAVKVGEALIPIIEKLASAMLDVINFFEKHTAVAIALAAAIGGPLVAAMLTYIGTLATSAIESFIAGWSSLIGMASKVVASLLSMTGAFDGNTAAVELNRAAYLEGAAAEDTFAASSTAASTSLAAIVAPLALIVGVGLGLKQTFEGMSVPIDKWSKQLQQVSTSDLPKTITQLEVMGKATGNADTAHRLFAAALKSSTDEADRFLVAAQQAGINTKGWAEEINKKASADRAATGAAQAYNELIANGTAKIDANTLATQKNMDAKMASTNATIAAQQADLAQSKALDDLTLKTYLAATAGGADKQANEDLTGALLSAEQQILATAAAHEKAGTSAADEKAQLETLAGTLDPSSPLAVWLNAYIATLNTIPPGVDTHVTVSGTDLAGQALRDFQASIGAIPREVDVVVKVG